MEHENSPSGLIPEFSLPQLQSLNNRKITVNLNPKQYSSNNNKPAIEFCVITINRIDKQSDPVSQNNFKEISPKH